jgi:hypothetical protein
MAINWLRTDSPLPSAGEEAVSGVFIWLSDIKPSDAFAALLFNPAMKYPG